MSNSYTESSFTMDYPPAAHEKVRLALIVVTTLIETVNESEVGVAGFLESLEAIRTKRVGAHYSSIADAFIGLEGALLEAVSTRIVELCSKETIDVDALHLLIATIIQEAADVNDELFNQLYFDIDIGTRDENCLYVKHLESIDMEQAVYWLQVLARAVPEMQPAGPWSATFCRRCDKAFVDAFGGGAVVFDCNRSEWTNTDKWIADKIEELKKEKT